MEGNESDTSSYRQFFKRHLETLKSFTVAVVTVLAFIALFYRLLFLPIDPIPHAVKE